MNLVNYRTEILSLFECQSSGQCCLASGYVYVTDSDISAMSKTMGISKALFISQFVKKINGWDVIASPNFRPKCFLNTTNHCEVYHNRPNACRTYPDWDNIWDSDEHIVKETQSCKGLKLAVQKFKNQNSNC